ncbi:hypothetical protein H1W37_19530 [Stappia taiwanensis]|uniref:Uncharacterized protein n=1 Tax=Stappia taiwanensis TaxID=992267 RepID=A0A838XTU6_9HYPH|nr:hypothetical protein [Stappia taiwanensis]MBA4613855.1 hypothetical protein [Stappia taiwanensis]GGE78995.1 hypothetical protein GCM10007285_03530 [Stappia taiwanensis]
MGEGTAWPVIGMAISAVGLVLALLARDRQMWRHLQSALDQLHERINRTRDEYVRRSDLDNHIQRLDKSVDDMRGDIRDMRREFVERLDKVIALHSRNGGGP